MSRLCSVTIGLGYTAYKLCELSISVRRIACLTEDVYMISGNVWELGCLLMRLRNSTSWNFQAARLQLSVKVLQRLIVLQ